MEYLLLIIEFHLIKKWKTYWVYLLFQILLGLLIFYQSNDLSYFKNAPTYHSNIITIIGILIGFTISVFAILLSVDNENIKEAKSQLIDKKLYSKSISLYESVLIEMAYVIIIQGLLLIANFIYPIFIDIESIRGKIFYSINVSVTTYSILLLMHNILNFYFILTKRK